MNRMINTSSKWARICCLFLFVFLSACSSLESVERQPEYTREPTDNSLWRNLTAIHSGNWQYPLNDGALAIDWRLRAIDSATESLDLQTFLWDLDIVGSLVLDHIIQAADRGVEVKLLIDDTFLAGQDDLILEIHEHPNIQYRIFNPYKRRSGSLITRMFLNLGEFSRLDHRMHNKAMIVDNRVAIVGGRNLADEYFGIHSAANFRDMELIVGGPIVKELSHSFDDYWNDKWSVPIDTLSHIKTSHTHIDAVRENIKKTGHIHLEEAPQAIGQKWKDLVNSAYTGVPVILVDTPPEDNPSDHASLPVQVANALVDLFDAAESEILIVSAYLIPTPTMEDAIERAVARGVHVKILTNSLSSNNHLAAHSSYQRHIKKLMHHGANLHEVRTDASRKHVYMFPPLDKKSLALHAKMLVIDNDKVFIGSANLDPRSLRLNTEMGLLVVSEELNKEIRRMIEPDFSHLNAWELSEDAEGNLIWVANDIVLNTQPQTTFMQRIEDWFISHLPIENEM